MAICFWEATFSNKSYHLSDCYRLYISCETIIGKALNYQIDLSDWYQLYISCEINIETPITLSNRYETIRSIFLQLMTVIVEWTCKILNLNSKFTGLHQERVDTYSGISCP